MKNTNVEQDLILCDQEQIQYIDTIQPVGSLIVTDASGAIVAAALEETFATARNSILGKPLHSVLGVDAARILEAVENRTEPTTPLLLKDRTSGTWLTCIGHSQGLNKVFEIERSPSRDVAIPSVKFMNERHGSLETYLAFIVENIQMITGFDRVMIYKFAPDCHGEVVAESLAANAHSFYGHHFPASDIPLPARELFTKIWARVISDVNAPPIPIKAAPNVKVDLSKSILRASASVHLEYLRNMNVRASLTLPIICEGKLWGLIACHHFTPKHLVAEERSVYSLLAKLISSRISTLVTNQSIVFGRRISEFASQLESELERENLEEWVRDHKRDFLKLFECDGFSLVGPRMVTSDGHAPPASELKRLVQQFNESAVHHVVTDSASISFPSNVPASCAGVMGFKAGNNWLLWTRKEVIRSVLWAGDPHKAAHAGDQPARLSPRLSFESWREDVRGLSASWNQYEIDAMQNFAQSVLRAIGIANARNDRDDIHFQQQLQSQIKHEVESLTSTFRSLNLEDLPQPEI